MSRLIVIVAIAAVLIGVLVLIASPGSGLGESLPGDPPASASSATSNSPPVSTRPHDIDAVRRLEKTAEAYRKAPGLHDTMRLEMLPPRGEAQQQTMDLRLASNGGSITMPPYEMTVVDGRLYVTNSKVPAKFVEAAIKEDLATTLGLLTGQDVPVPAHFAMRARQGVDAYLTGLTMGSLTEPVLSGVTPADGTRAYHELTVTAENGEGRIRIDAATDFVTRADYEFSPPGAPSSFRVKSGVRFAPTVPAGDAAARVRFDTDARRRVASLAELQPAPIGTGDIAPDFTLTALDGRSVTLSALRGKVVVLDFWATWCGPCIRGLPLLQEFATWAQSSGLDVEVYAVDTFQREGTPDRIRAAVESFWTSRAFTMPTLFDFDSSIAAAYGIRAIPRTFVIAPDGTVAVLHRGFDPNLATTLRRDVERILDDAG